MNHKVIQNICGKIMISMSGLMLLPLIVSFIYKEDVINYIAFIIPIILMFVMGKLLNVKKAKKSKIMPRDGFIIVSLSWFVMSLFGSLPFIISKAIPNFFDAFFEITSGFTTTGATILRPEDYDNLSKSMFFWRSFSHWIGGMGILVFILAIIPESKDGSSMHILRAESPGPQVGKLVSKMSVSSRLLYLIYIVLTAVEVLLLWIGPDKELGFFESLIYAFGTAGTGGFALTGNSIALYGAYTQYVIAIFMIIFGINFSMFYFILIKNFKEVFKNEELRWYFSIIIICVAIIFVSIVSTCKNAEEAFRLSLFQVASIMSTTGYSTFGYESWPAIAQMVIIILTIFGACAGSTAGGLKLSRVIIVIKSTFKKIKSAVNPRKVEAIQVDSKTLDSSTISSVKSYCIIYVLIFILCAFLISVDGFDITTNFTASLTCISNVGPGLGNIVGPSGNFASFSGFSKMILSIEMIAGRLELFPVVILFYFKTWKR